MLLWGTNYSVQKAVMAQIGPGALVFMRYLVTPACAIALLLWQYGLRWPRLDRRDWVSLVGLAALGHVPHVNMMTQTIHLSTPFSSALISALGPIFTLLLVRMLHSERFARIHVAGLVLGMVGVLMFLSDKLALVRTQGVGDLLLLFATRLFSAHTVAATRLFSRHGVTLVMACITLMATGSMLLINAPQALLVPWASLPAAIWGPCSGRWRSLRSRAGGLGLAQRPHGCAAHRAPALSAPVCGGLYLVDGIGRVFQQPQVTGAVMAGVGVAVTQFGANGSRRGGRRRRIR